MFAARARPSRKQPAPAARPAAEVLSSPNKLQPFGRLVAGAATRAPRMDDDKERKESCRRTCRVDNCGHEGPAGDFVHMTKRRGQDVIDKNRKYINVCKTCYPSEQAKNDSSRSSGKIRESMLEDKLE